MARAITKRTEPSHISLGWLVPAFSAVILAGAVATFGLLTYRFARKSALETASARLATVAEAFSQPAQPGPAWVRLARGIASSQGMLTIVRSKGRMVTEGVPRQFAEMLADTSQSLAVDVRATDGTILYSRANPRADTVLALGGASSIDQPQSRSVVSGDVSGARVGPDSLRLARSYPDSAAQSALYQRGGWILYERAVPIRDSGRVAAHLVEVRKLTVTAATRRQLVRLVGENAELVVSNVDGSLWFNLNESVGHAGQLDVAPEYERDGRRWLSATANLPGAPWRLSVEFPVNEVLAPVRVLGRQLFLIGTLVVILGVIVSERLSRKLTVPLTKLTVAAENIAAGDRVTRGFELARSDEVGRLSRAFAAMADSIRESHDTLEDTIGHRTAELETALVRLRETQDELLRKERLATLGQISSSIAHELRNPLGVMTNSVYYLDTVLKDAPPKVRDHLAKLRTQVRLSDSIIRGLLDATRTTTASPAEVSSTDLIEEQLARVDVPASVRLERAMATTLPLLRVDPVQIGQVLMNLLHNAVQAMEDRGGVLTVRTTQVPSGVAITIADTGPGVPEEIRARIFEPLFTTKARGIGLGLAVSKTLTQVNGGSLTVENNPTGGAQFTLVLPTVTAPQAMNGDGDGSGSGARASMSKA